MKNRKHNHINKKNNNKTTIFFMSTIEPETPIIVVVGVVIYLSLTLFAIIKHTE